ncbi:acyl-CoA thioester hydrolase [Amycolatopsis marina]|uniref:Acyl-CoA thioester hydrolase n=1 Tax=Amycolatopsis marina TaxID=490629 RepID=A0A1I0ZMJ7_9PSEU|nr:thioesterase family protein [Amycolatopsis marina]SFB26306.1 acyl-CoA thioester hydrolase [Amycolatopsis marina]
MDVFRHVNHANMVTLLEEARVPLLFGDNADPGLPGFAEGIVVVRLSVDYRAPVVVRGAGLRVKISLRELRFASFTLDYEVRDGLSEKDILAVSAQTTLAPYDVRTGRPRRLSEDEREFLRKRLDGSGGSDA